MPARKLSEQDFASLIKSYNGFIVKIPDAGKCPRCHTVMSGAKRPFDYMFSVNGIAGALEVKSTSSPTLQFASGFDEKTMEIHQFIRGEIRDIEISGIMEHQRRGLSAFADKGGLAWMGVQFGERVGGKTNPRRLFLVPWLHWMQMEAGLLQLGSLSISLAPHQLAIRNSPYNGEKLLNDYEIERIDGEWKIPSSHVFSRLYNLNR